MLATQGAQLLRQTPTPSHSVHVLLYPLCVRAARLLAMTFLVCHDNVELVEKEFHPLSCHRLPGTPRLDWGGGAGRGLSGSLS